MKTSNQVNEALRESDVGQVWVEALSGAQGTLQLAEVQTFRVRATGATTVTIDGILAMTMSNGEIALFNTGHGNPDDTSPYVSVQIAGANAFVQVAQERDRQRLQPNPYNLLSEPVGTGESP